MSKAKRRVLQAAAWKHARYQQAWVAMLDARREDAGEILGSLLERFPGDPTTLMLIGRLSLDVFESNPDLATDIDGTRVRPLAVAEAALDQALAATPDLPWGDLHWCRASVLSRLGRMADACAEAEKAAALGPMELPDVTVVKSAEPLPSWDLHVSLFSLPALHGTTPATLPETA